MVGGAPTRANLGGVDREARARCTEECTAFAQAHTACADACPSAQLPPP